MKKIMMILAIVFLIVGTILLIIQIKEKNNEAILGYSFALLWCFNCLLKFENKK